MSKGYAKAFKYSRKRPFFDKIGHYWKAITVRKIIKNHGMLITLIKNQKQQFDSIRIEIYKTIKTNDKNQR